MMSAVVWLPVTFTNWSECGPSPELVRVRLTIPPSMLAGRSSRTWSPTSVTVTFSSVASDPADVASSSSSSLPHAARNDVNMAAASTHLNVRRIEPPVLSPLLGEAP